MKLPSDIFKAYNIRGIVGKTLTPPIVHAVGQALGSLAQERGRDTIVIARDGRNSGPELGRALGDGIRASGAHVIDIGMVTTPTSSPRNAVSPSPAAIILPTITASRW